jgi:hypothetical protein
MRLIVLLYDPQWHAPYLPGYPFIDDTHPRFDQLNCDQCLQRQPIVTTLSQQVDGIFICLLYQIEWQIILLVDINQSSHLWVVQTLWVGGAAPIFAHKSRQC